jgi:hypothetical protein
MQPQSNKIARQLSSMPQTHRQSTLSAIAQKHHQLNAAVAMNFNKAEKLKALLDEAPAHAPSRLAWVQSQLNQL